MILVEQKVEGESAPQRIELRSHYGVRSLSEPLEAVGAATRAWARQPLGDLS